MTRECAKAMMKSVFFLFFHNKSWRDLDENGQEFYAQEVTHVQKCKYIYYKCFVALLFMCQTQSEKVKWLNTKKYKQIK